MQFPGLWELGSSAVDDIGVARLMALGCRKSKWLDLWRRSVSSDFTNFPARFPQYTFRTALGAHCDCSWGKSWPQSVLKR